MDEQILALINDWKNLGQYSMKPEAVKKFLSDHYNELSLFGFPKLEKKRREAIAALKQELKASELNVLKELDNHGLALIEASMYYANKHAMLAAYNQLRNPTPSETPFQDFTAMVNDLDPKKVPIEQRLALDHIGACGNQLHLELLTRYHGQKLEQLILWIFDVAHAWLGRRIGVIEISFFVSYEGALLRAGLGQSKERQSEIGELIQTFQDGLSSYIMQEFEESGGLEAFENLLSPEGSEEW